MGIVSRVDTTWYSASNSDFLVGQLNLYASINSIAHSITRLQVFRGRLQIILISHQDFALKTESGMCHFDGRRYCMAPCCWAVFWIGSWWSNILASSNSCRYPLSIKRFQEGILGWWLYSEGNGSALWCLCLVQWYAWYVYFSLHCWAVLIHETIRLHLQSSHGGLWWALGGKMFHSTGGQNSSKSSMKTGWKNLNLVWPCLWHNDNGGQKYVQIVWQIELFLIMIDTLWPSWTWLWMDSILVYITSSILSFPSIVFFFSFLHSFACQLVL